MRPNLQRTLVLCSLAASLLTGGLQAQSILTLNIDSSPSAVLRPNPLSVTATIPNSGNALTILGNTDGTRFYVIGKTSTPAVQVYDSTFNTPLASFNFSAAPTAAALSPDGTKLVVVAGSIRVINTVTNTDLTSASGGINAGGTPIDLAISLDSSRAFVLSGDTGQLETIDITGTTLANAAIQVALGSTSVSISPDGLLNVTAPGKFLRFEPKTLASVAQIDLNGLLLLKPVYSGDAVTAVGAVTNAPTGVTYAAAVVNLSTAKFDHGVTAAPPDPFTQLIYGVNDVVYAYAAQTQRLFQFKVTDTTATVASFGGVFLDQVYAVAGSTEVFGAKTLYIVNNQGVYRADLLATTNILTGPTPVVGLPRGLVFIPRANRGAIPYGTIIYNNNQKILQGATSLPFLLREYDINGNPVAGDSVTFSAPLNGIGVTPIQTNTTTQGYAQAYLTVGAQSPATTGVFNATYGVTGTQIAPFNFTVLPNSGGGNPGGNPGGGGNPGTTTGAGLFIVQGNGEAVAQSFPSPLPLTVLARDANGNPVPGVTVTFAIVSGQVAISQSNTAITGADGTAAVVFTGAGFLPPASGEAVSTITATATIGLTSYTTTFTVVTIANSPNGLNGTVNPYLVKPPNAQTTFTGATNTTLAGAIQVAVSASNGAALTGVGLRLDQTGVNPLTQPYVSCDGPGGVALVDVNGIATCNLVFNGVPGAGTFRIVIGENRALDANFNFTITGGSPSTIKIVNGNNQTGSPGQALGQPFTVQVMDATNVAVSNTPVTFTVLTTNGGSLSSQTVTTNATGQATTNLTLGSAVGPVTIQAKAGVATATFTATITALAKNLIKVSGDVQSGITGVAFGQPVVVQVTDSTGKPVPGASVGFAVTTGSASVGAATVATDSNGQAATIVTAGATAGPIVVTATAAGVTATFNLTSAAPGPQITAKNIVNAASFQSGITPGALVSIIGKGIAPSVQGVVTPSLITGPLPTSLAGVSVTFNGISAPIFAVSNVNGQEQVTVQVPFELPTGVAAVAVTGGGGTTTINNVPVLPIQPGIFEYTDGNNRRSAVLTRPDGSFVTPSNPARRGETITMYATGLGQVTPATGTNRIGLPNQMVIASGVVGINNAGVQILSALYQPGSIGLYQVQFVIPNDAATGSNLPLALAFFGPDGKYVFGNGSLISIQ